MLRRQARLRREYLYRKSVEDKHKQLQEKKERLKRSLDEGIPIHGDLRREALSLQDKLKWTDEGILLQDSYLLISECSQNVPQVRRRQKQLLDSAVVQILQIHRTMNTDMRAAKIQK